MNKEALVQAGWVLLALVMSLGALWVGVVFDGVLRL